MDIRAGFYGPGSGITLDGQGYSGFPTGR